MKANNEIRDICAQSRKQKYCRNTTFEMLRWWVYFGSGFVNAEQGHWVEHSCGCLLWKQEGKSCSRRDRIT